MKKFLYKLWLTIALAIPVITFAAPSPVNQIEVEYSDNQVVVSWTKVPEQNITAYRVYYSSESILENQGAYDDFKATDGPKSLLSFDEFKAGQKVYFSVVAVDDASVESPGFVEEVSVTVPANIDKAPEFQLPNRQNSSDGTLSISSVSSSQSSSSVEPTTVELLSAQATSPQQVQLNFSTFITVENSAAQNAFKIVDRDGDELFITKLEINGLDVRLGTESQVKNMIYEVQLSEPIEGFLNAEPLDETARRAFFTGHPNGNDTKTSSTTSSQVSSGSNSSISSVASSQNSSTAQVADSLEQPADVQNLRFNAVRNVYNLYDVQVEWDVPVVTGGLAYYLISQTTDGGRTYSDVQLVQAGIGGVQIPNVAAGSLGVNVQTVNALGYMSRGVYDAIQLALTAPSQSSVSSSSSSSPVPTNPVQGQVITNPLTGKGGDQLPQTGTAFILLTMGGAGAIAGLKRSRSTYKRT